MGIKRIARSVIAVALVTISCRGPAGDQTSTLGQPGTIIDTAGTYAAPFGGALDVTADGAAHYALPLVVPAGTAGMQPALALSYSSRGGNGLVGVGWSVSGLASAITRCGRTLSQGGPVGVTFTSTDSLCLDGNRLVQIAGAGYFASDAEYRTEQETFAKIVAHAADANGPTSFTVYTKDGRILTFGDSADARLEAERDGSKATVRFGWLLHTASDRAGNAMTYAYDRAPTDASTIEYMPARIDYGGRRAVTFSYDARPDVNDTWLAGVRFSTTKRLSEVVTWGPLGDGSDPAPVRRYRLAYRDGAGHRSLLETIALCDGTLAACTRPIVLGYSRAADVTFGAAKTIAFSPAPVQLYAADINGDGRSDLLYSGGDGYDYLKLSAGGDFGPATKSDAIRGRTQPFDIDGDGKVDVFTERKVVTSKDQVTAYPEFHRLAASGAIVHDTTDPSWTAWDPPAQTGAQMPNGHIVDVDGDLLGDYVYTDSAGELLYIKQSPTAPHWAESPRWLVGGLDQDHPPQFVDIDGDGVTDVVYAAVTEIGGPFYYATAGGLVSNLTAGFCDVFADVNGDGLPDGVNLYGGVSVALNHGNGRFDTAARVASTFTGTPCMDGTVHVVDLDQDGKQDILLLGADQATATALISRVDPLTHAVGFDVEYPAIAVGGTNTAQSQTLDADGDGLFDVLVTRGDGTGQLYLQQAGHADLLVSVTDALGATNQLEYAPLQAGLDYTPGTGCGGYPDRCYTGPMLVVTTERRDTRRTTGEPLQVSAYHWYRDMRVNLEGDGMLGFASHQMTDPRTGVVTETTFDRTRVQLAGAWRHPLRGLPTLVVTTAPGLRTTQTTTSYLTRAWTSGTWSAIPATFETRTYEDTTLLSDLVTTIGDLAPDATVDPATYHVDGYGNVTATTVAVRSAISGVLDAGEVRTTSTRVYNTDADHVAQWLLGEVASEATTSATPNGRATRTVAHEYDPRGLEIATTVQPADTGSQYLRTTITRDARGLPVASQACTYAGACRASTTIWDADAIHATAATNALQQVSRTQWAGALDVPLAATDPDQRVTGFDRDRLGRLVATHRPDGVVESITYANDDAPLKETVDTGDGQVLVTYRDHLGRPVDQTSLAFDSTAIHTTTSYDTLGRVACVSRPHRASAPAKGMCYAYDELGRVLSIRRDPSPGHESEPAPTQRFAYHGNATDAVDETCPPALTVGDPACATTRTVRDAQGRIVSTVIDASSQPITTRFTYGPFDTLIGTSDAAGNVVTMAYDALGRRTDQTDGDTGHTVRSYDGFGDVVATTDAKQQTATYAYDALGRLVRRSAPDGVDSWTFDPPNATGSLASKVRGSIATSYGYRSDGRLRHEAWTVDGETFPFDYDYDAQGRLRTTAFPMGDGEPSRFTTERVYTRSGELAAVMDATDPDATRHTPIWRALAEDAEGHVTQEQLDRDRTTPDRNTYTFREFDPATGRITRIRAPNVPYYPYDMTYEYLPNGNLASRTDHWQNRTESFTYDRANRLAIEQLSGMQPARYAYAPQATFEYDSLGNVKRSTEYLPGCTFNYAEHGAGPHQMTSLSCDSYPYPFTNTYDANGNQTANYRQGLTASWTSFDKPLELQNGYGSYGRIHYTYDADHTRIKRETLAPTGTEPYTTYSGMWGTTITIGPYEKRWGNQLPTMDHVIRILVGDRAVAERVWRTDGQDGTVQWVYHLHDAQGSIERSLDASGAAIEWASYDAFGAKRGYQWDGSGAGPFPTTRHGYTGARGEDELGLIDLGDRVYDALYKRFLSADSVIPNASYGPAWNRYSYAFNNPLRYTDPSGHMPTSLAAFFSGTSVSGLVGEAWQNGLLGPGSDGATTAGLSLGDMYELSWSAFQQFASDVKALQEAAAAAGYPVGIDESGRYVAFTWDAPDSGFRLHIHLGASLGSLIHGGSRSNDPWRTENLDPTELESMHEIDAAGLKYSPRSAAIADLRHIPVMANPEAVDIAIELFEAAIELGIEATHLLVPEAHEKQWERDFQGKMEDIRYQFRDMDNLDPYVPMCHKTFCDGTDFRLRADWDNRAVSPPDWWYYWDYHWHLSPMEKPIIWLHPETLESVRP
jgi:RHS repeat-associated protein